MTFDIIMKPGVTYAKAHYVNGSIDLSKINVKEMIGKPVMINGTEKIGEVIDSILNEDGSIDFIFAITSQDLNRGPCRIEFTDLNVINIQRRGDYKDGP